ncbi:hypothetical protein BUALT_Bualt08G0057300 [Buddleja alternifolia]|uniref:Uncharacterized protein n=1 Tax=Buddleja alternifolia TaxID=168488 RepID=A0AAV6X595_9LAMI|nr:hypothetical protein BUALT_Bualt08G0057300 [Buddleja alternifolia]
MGILRNVDIQHKQQPRLGGTRATVFVFAMSALETMAFVSNGVSLVTYFYGYMNFSLTKSATALTNFMGTAFLLPLFGGFISDTYLSRFKTCLIFGCLEIVGFGVLAVQAHFKQLRPYPCKDKINQCEAATTTQEAILFTGLYLVALGTGGVKAALPALGADQFDENDPEEAASLSSFFNWYMFSFTFGAIFGVTFVVWISTNLGWDWSFGVCAIAVAMAILFLSMGKSVYRTNVPNGRSPLARILQVFVAAVRNRNVAVPDKAEELHEIHDKEAEQNEILQRTNQFKTFNSSNTITIMFILIPIYDRFFVPLARKFTGIPTGITQLQRVAVGLVLSSISMAVSGIIETHRKNVAIKNTMVDSPGPLPISVFWLGIQYAIFGMADMFTLVGLLEFFYGESSSGMKSLSTAISWCSLAFGYYTSTVVVNVVNKYKKVEVKQGEDIGCVDYVEERIDVSIDRNSTP